ncbi:CARDB domain-containing protein, partial [Haloferax profundi]|uniref:CARDB domain-containing protein n=1 Tax=Haloferax profundi TaxID=1544718 RepID=UPI002F3E6165
GTKTVSNKDTVELVEGVQLNVEASSVEIQQGNSVTLNVTRADTGERVSGANVTYNGKTFTTDANGQVTFTPVEGGTAEVTKDTEGGTAFAKTSIDLYVITPEMDLIDYNVSSTSITTADTLTVNATVQNFDSFDGKFNLDLKKDGQVVDSKTVTVPADSTVTKQFELTFDAKGTYDITVNNAPATAVEVTGVPDMEYSNLQVPSQVSPGENTVVSADIVNNGTGAGDYNASLVIDGDVVSWMNGTLTPGEETTVTFEKALGPGTYDITVGELPAQTVSVQKPANLEYSNLQVNDSVVGLEDAVEVNATVTNTGDVSDTFTATLSVDDEITQTKEVTLDAGESKTVSFIVSDLGLGAHTVRVGDLSPETVTVKAPDFTASISAPTDVKKGTVPVTATVRNIGNVDATDVDVIVEAQAACACGWTELSSKSVDIDAGDSVEISTTLSRNKTRNYTVRVVADPSNEFVEADEDNNASSQEVTGGPLAKGVIYEGDDDRAANDPVYVANDDPDAEDWIVGQNLTDSQGRFLVPILNDTPQTIGYVQADATGLYNADFPRDQSPDIWTLENTTGSDGILDLRKTHLPQTGVLNIAVVDQDGEPVQNARIAVLHKKFGTRSGVVFNSNEDGLFPVGENNRT